MLRAIINFSLQNRFAVILIAAALTLGGVYALRNLPLDAIPDLSDTQVIVYTEWPGQAPQIVQDQVTYPLTAKMLSVPGAKTVRGYSFYGFSFVYVIFADGTDPYWARSRVLEYLNGMKSSLPEKVTPVLGPDATGVGWAFIYTLQSKNRSLAELRSLQDWHLRYKLASVSGVAEVASVGGFVKQYQVSVDPNKLRAYNLALPRVAEAIRNSNSEVGGRALELGEKEFIVRIHGYLTSPDDIRKISLGADADGIPILLGQVAEIALGPDMRRGIAELNGEGETVGGIVIVRQGANARQVISDVKKRLEEVKSSLPPDVHIQTAYDRTALIDRAVQTLESKLFEECLAVALVCLLFLMHLRSALVAIIVLPLAVLASFLIMHAQGISSNIMSLGGIAIAIGAMVDAAIIMIENAHKHLEQEKDGIKSHWEIIRDASLEVGPTLFFSLLLITVSFLPVFTLQEQEGRLFKPLAFTKTYAMAAAALLSITLAPVLMGFFIRGHIISEQKNPVSYFLIWVYQPLLDLVLRFRKTVLLVAVLLVAGVFFPWNRIVVAHLPDGKIKTAAGALGILFPFQNIGSEFMPPLYEGDLLYMPTTMPGIAADKAKALLQQTDKLIRTFPEVANVFGKIGRAETATDPAPLDMIETTITLKPEKDWPAVAITDSSGKVIAQRPRTPDELIDALDRTVRIPGLTNAWTMPIRTRIDMLATGIKTPVGLKVCGSDPAQLEKLAIALENIIRQIPGTASVFAERIMGGNYLNIVPDRDAIARYGLTINDMQTVLEAAAGGTVTTNTVEGLERYSVLLRYDRDFREDLDALRNIMIPTPRGAQIPLEQLAKIELTRGPMSIKSEAAVPNAWIYIDVRDTDLGTYVKNAQRTVRDAIASGTIKVPDGVSLVWSGQFEYLQRAQERLAVVIPLTLLIIILILYFNTGSLIKTGIVLLAVPFSLVGAFWLLYLCGYHLSVAVWIGLIALAGLDAETGVVMLLYLDLAYGKRLAAKTMHTTEDLKEAIHAGAVQRVRPKIMTATVIIAGLLPIMWSHGAGADVMKRIAAPMIGGVVTSVLLELAVYPIIFYIWKQRSLKKL